MRPSVRSPPARAHFFIFPPASPIRPPYPSPRYTQGGYCHFHFFSSWMTITITSHYNKKAQLVTLPLSLSPLLVPLPHPHSTPAPTTTGGLGIIIDASDELRPPRFGCCAMACNLPIHSELLGQAQCIFLLKHVQTSNGRH